MSQKQTILITGATSGIGRHAALHLAQKGHRVFATGRNRSALDELTREAHGLPLEALRLDVTDPSSIEAVRLEIDRRTAGRGVDVLVNNAGYGHLGPVDLVSDADMRAQYETNVFGLMNVTRSFLPAMRERGAGRIVNVSSIGGRVTLPLFGVYNSTKYALESLSDAMRIELAPFGIHVSLVEPGVINTGFGERSMGLVSQYKGTQSPYDAILAKADELQVKTESFGVSPKSTSRAIERAATSRWPRARYVAPFFYNFMLAAMPFIPTRLVDWAMRRSVGLTRKNLGSAPRKSAPIPAEPQRAAA